MANAGPARPLRAEGDIRVGLFGGTFDPPHVGHISTAAMVRFRLSLDAVWCVVANRPWQKVGAREVSPAADRLAMVEEAVKGVPGVVASSIEVDRGGDSYTADTLAQLRREQPGLAPFVVVGADAAAGLLTWQRADEVAAGSTVVLVDRPGLVADDPPAGWEFTRVSVPRIDVSSTDLRRRVRAGEPIDGLVPPAVRALIGERGLYRAGS